MTSCLYGSEKKPSAPSSFSVDVGAVCFLLGIDNVICPLLDKIPSVVGKPWKEIINTVAKESLGLVIDVALGQIDTNSFCSVAPPVLPSEITFIEVFDFIASYVPPFSLVASGDGLLKKITQYYLYNKWNEFCQCKERKKEPNPNLPNVPPIAPFSGLCAASQVHKAQIDLRIDFVNSRNVVSGQETNHTSLVESTGQTLNSTANDIINMRTALDNRADFSKISSVPTVVTPNVNTVNSNIGCVKVIEERYFPVTVDIRDTYRRNSDGFTESYRYGWQVNRTWYITIDEKECCTPPPPPPPNLPPPPQNCIPVPPPRYCELFPNDPLCANVSPDNANDNPTDILVADYGCAIGDFTKTVQWKL